MNEDGDDVKQVSFLDLDCYSPKFQPKTNKILVSATNRISDYLYMIDLDDTSTFRFPTFIDGGLDPQFSADGTMLMYRSEKDLNNAIYIMDMATGETFPISDGSLATQAEFSHDGQKIVYSSSAEQNFDLVVLNLTDTTDDAQTVIVCYTREEALGQNLRGLRSELTDIGIYDSMWEALWRGEAWAGELVNRRKDGSLYTEATQIAPVRQPDGRIEDVVRIVLACLFAGECLVRRLSIGTGSGRRSADPAPRPKKKRRGPVSPRRVAPGKPPSSRY